MTEQKDFLGGGGRYGNGYAAPPGSGPQGERCGTCRHCKIMPMTQRRYYKCEIGTVTRGAATDIRLKSPACEKWEQLQAVLDD